MLCFFLEPDVVPDIGAPLGSKAPVWTPDLRATMCTMCTCEFTLTWRRHRGRACGKVTAALLSDPQQQGGLCLTWNAGRETLTNQKASLKGFFNQGSGI